MTASPTGRPFFVPPKQSTSTPSFQVISFGFTWSVAIALAIQTPPLPSSAKRRPSGASITKLTRAQPLGIADSTSAKPIRIAAGEVRFDDVTFRYGAHPTPLYSNLNVTIPRGQRVHRIGHLARGEAAHDQQFAPRQFEFGVELLGDVFRHGPRPQHLVMRSA